MAAHKSKENNKLASHVHIRKFHASILFGAQREKQILPAAYVSGMETYLEAYLKETKKVKQKGNLDEADSDPKIFQHVHVSVDVLWWKSLLLQNLLVQWAYRNWRV